MCFSLSEIIAVPGDGIVFCFRFVQCADNFLGVAVYVQAFWALSLEVRQYYSHVNDRLGRQMALSLLWTVYASGLLMSGVRRNAAVAGIGSFWFHGRKGIPSRPLVSQWRLPQHFIDCVGRGLGDVGDARLQRTIPDRRRA